MNMELRRVLEKTSRSCRLFARTSVTMVLIDKFWEEIECSAHGFPGNSRLNCGLMMQIIKQLIKACEPGLEDPTGCVASDHSLWGRSNCAFWTERNHKTGNANKSCNFCHEDLFGSHFLNSNEEFIRNRWSVDTGANQTVFERLKQPTLSQSWINPKFQIRLQKIRTDRNDRSCFWKFQLVSIITATPKASQNRTWGNQKLNSENGNGKSVDSATLLKSMKKLGSFPMSE